MEAFRDSPRLAVLVIFLGMIALIAGSDGSTLPPSDVRIAIAGPRHMVFDWSKEACEPTQVADLPARAFRDDRGRVQMLLSHFDNFRMVGPSLNRLRVHCRAVMRSDQDSNPAHYRDKEWLAALYTRNGRRVWALVHDEYQGNLHPGHCPQQSYHQCWYNAITLAISSDGGRSFHDARKAGRLVAIPPYRYRPGSGPVGVFAPTNLVERDGYVYALMRFRDPDGAHGTCIMRSRKIWRPGSWRMWEGSRFDGRFTDPYRRPEQRSTACRPISPTEIGEMAETLVFSPTLRRYILVGMAADRTGSQPRDTGVYFSTSNDLNHWTPRRLLLRAPTVQTHRCGQASPIAYPAVLDPSSSSRTFGTTDRTAYLYLTQLHYRHCKRTPNRDLVRVPIKITAPHKHG